MAATMSREDETLLRPGSTLLRPGSALPRPGSAAPRSDASVEPGVYTDTHAHLSHVEERLGAKAVDAVLASYARSWAGFETRVHLAADRTAVDRPAADRSILAPFILDIGVNPGDLARGSSVLGTIPSSSSPPVSGQVGKPSTGRARLSSSWKMT